MTRLPIQKPNEVLAWPSAFDTWTGWPDKYYGYDAEDWYLELGVRVTKASVNEADVPGWPEVVLERAFGATAA